MLCVVEEAPVLGEATVVDVIQWFSRRSEDKDVAPLVPCFQGNRESTRLTAYLGQIIDSQFMILIFQGCSRDDVTIETVPFLLKCFPCAVVIPLPSPRTMFRPSLRTDSSPAESTNRLLRARASIQDRACLTAVNGVRCIVKDFINIIGRFSVGRRGSPASLSSKVRH